MNGKYKLLCKEDKPYDLDYMVGCDEQVVALTKKNSDFIEAVVNLDSNYKKESQNIPPHKDFNPETYDDNDKNLYCGSMMYWFDKIKKSEGKFETNILGAIIAVDRSNSTHLQASENGRKVIREIICSKCKTVDELKNEMEKDLKDDSHLIKLMSVPIKANGKDGNRSNLSFASKFCTTAARHLGCPNNYSKYDGVVAKALPLYSKVYLDKQYKKSYFSTSDINKKYSIYIEYAKVIEDIIVELKKENISLNKDEIDHIIWYTSKGNEEDK